MYFILYLFTLRKSKHKQIQIRKSIWNYSIIGLLNGLCN